ncbi:MAG TPA: SIR2 family protein, partial [Bryobacteraceae bacterium]|nr:SIR2 family protein [Bryobacteraceae bacterium]
MLSETVLDWILDRETCFLLGSGASRCAGKPLINDLTAQVANVVSSNTRDLLSNLKGAFDREPTVEDLINYLLRMRDLTAARRTVDPADWSIEEIDGELKSIQEAISNAIGRTWQASDVHASFFRRLLGQKNRSMCDVFTLNYDTLIEATLEHMGLRYIDGFWGADSGVFDAATFDEKPLAGNTIRLYKLHGSINWHRDDSGVVRRCPVASTGNGARLLIYPTQQKYVQTQ